MFPLQVLLIASDVDDQLAVNQQVEQSTLLGHCDFASSITDAMEKLATQGFHGVVLNVNSDTDTSVLLADLKRQHIPCLVLAKVGEEDAVIHLMQQGASNYLIKDPDRNYLKLLPITLQKAIEVAQLEKQAGYLTTQKRTEAKILQQDQVLLMGQQKVLELLALDTPLTEILNLLLQTLEEQAEERLGSILFLKGKHLWHGAAPSLPEDYIQAINGIEIGPQAGSCGTAVYRKEPVIVTDIATDPLWENYRDLATLHGLQACWSVPIFSKSGTVLGTFALYYREPYTPRLEDWKWVTVATHLASLAIERKQTEYALIQSERRFRATFEQAAVGICHIALDGRFLRFNQQLCEISGYSPEKLKTLTFQEITHPDDLPLDLQRIQHLLRGNRATYTLEKRYIRQDRSIVWVDLTVSMVREPSGEPSYLIAVIQDISDRKQVEVNLRESEQRYASLAEVVPVGIFRTDLQGNCHYVNDHWCQIAGLEPNQALNSGWLQAIHLEDRESVFAEWQLAIQEQRPFQSEYRFQRIDGTISWVYGQAVAEYAADGQIVGFVGTITNITDRKQAEADLYQLNQELESRVEQRTAELQQLNRQLQQSIAERQKLAALVENSTDFIMIATPSGRLTYLNQAGRQLVGLDETEEITSYSIPDFHFPDDWEELQQTVMQTLAKGGSWQGEVRLCHFQTQAAIPMMHSAFPIRHPKTGGILAIAGILQNITDRKQTENALYESQQFLQTVLDSFPMSVFWKDRDSIFLGCNRHFLQDAGLSSVTQLIGKTDYEMPWSNTDADAYRTDDQQVMNTNEAKLGIIESQMHPDGHRIWLETNKIPLHNRMGEVIGVLGTYQDISERKRAEVALQESERRFATLAEAAPAAIFRTGTAGQCVYMNDRWGEMTGRATAEGFGWGWTETIHPEDRQRITAEVTQWVQKCKAGDLYRNESRILHSDGSIRWFFCQMTPEIDSSGIITGCVGTLIDITDRKRAEAALRGSERRFATLAAAAPVAIFRFDTEGQCIYVNDRWSEMTSRPIVEALGWGWTDTLHPDDRKRTSIEVGQWVQGCKAGDLYRNEARILRPDGSAVWFFCQMLPETDPTDKIIGYVGTLTDISDRKQAEVALQQSEERYRALMDGASDAILLADLEGNLLTGNRKAEALLGYTREEISHLTVAQIHPPQELDRHIAAFSNISQSYFSQVPDTRVLCKDGTTIPVDITSSVVEVGDKQIILGIFRDITERKETEERLRDSESSLLEAQRVAHIGNWSFDVQTQTITWSEELYNMFGLDPSQPAPDYEEYLTKIHPHDRALLIQCIETAIVQGTAYNIDYQAIMPDGSIRYHEGRGEAVRNPYGQVIKLLGTALDITDRKQSELELKRNRELRDAIFNKSTDALFLVDSATELIIDCNERAVEMFEAESKVDLLQISGNTLQRYPFSPDDLAAIIEEVETTGFWNRELEYVTRKGKCFWANIAGTTVTAANEPIRLVRLSDITDRKQIELRLHQQLEKEQLLVSVLSRIRDSLDLKAILQITVDEVRNLIQSDRVLVYQIHTDSTGLAVAESVVEPWRRILDTSFPAEAFPPSCYQRYVQGEIYIINDRHNAPIRECMVQFMQEFQIRAKLVVPIVQQENRKLWGLLIAHECSASREWESWEIGLLQQLAGQLAIAIQQADLYQQIQAELVERQRAEANLQQANEQLQLANQELARATRLKDEFLASMSHELRTPLNAVLGMSEALQDNTFGTLNEQQKKALATVETSGRHLLELINDILDLAKIEAGKLEFNRSPYSVKILCSSSLDLIKQLAYEKNIQLNCSISPHIHEIKVEIDERRIRQVLINLLSNAIKFTPTGGTVTLEVWEQSQSTEPEMNLQHCIYFSVVDTGIGIAPDDLPKLFQSFVQIDSRLSRQYNGTGLGLALVKRITELHDGWVEVESKLNQGSRFTVVLPYTPETNADPIQPLTSKMASLQNSQDTQGTFSVALGRKTLILLAEDNQANVETYSNYLIHAGYELVVASDGLEAISLATRHKPDIILMDIQMPNMDGLEAISHIRTLPELSDTPIIALTALAMPGDREKCMEAGANEYLSKPIRLRSLINIISQILDP